MATATYVHDGKSIDYTPGWNVSAGDVVIHEELVGIAQLDVASGSLGALAVTGVFDMPKATGTSTAIDLGIKLYWDEDDQQAKADDESGANKYLGKAVAAATDADATVRVRLEQ